MTYYADAKPANEWALWARSRDSKPADNHERAIQAAAVALRDHLYVHDIYAVVVARAAISAYEAVLKY